MHDIFCMHIGQCGLQIGYALWELLTVEHGIKRDGIMTCDDEDDKTSSHTFFNCSITGQYIPRSIFVDLEPTVIDQMRNGSYRQLYHPDQLINGHEDASNNFARGFHTVGRLLRQICVNRIRKEFELSDRIQGIHIYRSLGGGTGSGMTATIFEILLDYPKTAKIEIPIYPSPHLSCAIVEPYNSILSEHFCMEDIDISTLIDNESLYEIVMNQMNINEPTFHNINRLIAQVCSSLTSSCRFKNELNNDFSVLTNLVPYPRIHFPLLSYAPFGSEAKISKSINSVNQITCALFNPSNQLLKCDPVNGKYMSCSLIYRGKISPIHVFNALANIKGSNLVRFVDWCPTGFKVGIVNQPPIILPNSQLGQSGRNVVMMTNSSAVSILWHRLSQKFHKLYSKRSFVHWFVSEGLEESEFCESLYNIATLAKDYEEVALDTKVEGIDTSDDLKDPNITIDNNNDKHFTYQEPIEIHQDDIEIKEEDDDKSEQDMNDRSFNENVSNATRTKLSLLNVNVSHLIERNTQLESLLPNFQFSCKEVKYFSISDSENISTTNPNSKSFSTEESESPLKINSKFNNVLYELEKSKRNQNSPNTFPNNLIFKGRICHEYKEPLIKSDNYLSDKHYNLKCTNFTSSKKSDCNLTLPSQSSPSKSNTESLFSTNDCDTDGSDVDGNELETFSLMENLIRLTLEY